MTTTPTLTGRVVLITGATNGIGRAAARELAGLGATVVVAGRSPERAAATVAEIQQAVPGAQVDSLVADLSVQAEVRRLAHEFKQRYARLDVLVNNAGAVFADRRETPDGLELTFALNHLSYFLLTCELLDVLRASAPARIVNVASNAHLRAGRLDFDDLQSRRRYFAYTAYGRSKLANILFTRELARRLQGSGVTANCLHPGLVHTGFGAGNGPLWALLYVFINALGRTPEQGARTVVYLAASPEVEGVTGQYFVDCRPARPSRAAQDDEAARRLWEVSEALVGMRKT